MDIELMRRYGHSLILLFFSLTGAVLYAQPHPGVQFEKLTGESINSLSVNALFQDHRGVIWVGSQTGLYRFDGYQLLRVTEVDSSSQWLQFTAIDKIVQDATKRIWVISWEGVAFWSQAHNKFIEEEKLTPFSITSVITGSDSTFWMGTDRGIIHFNPISRDLSFFQAPEYDQREIENEYYQELFIDSDEIWIGSILGIRKFDLISHTFSEIIISNSSNEDDVTGFAKDQFGTLWAGTLQQGLFKKSPENESFEHLVIENPYQNNTLTSVGFIAFDARTNDLWISDWGTGLYLLDPKKGKIIYSYSSNQSNSKNVTPLIYDILFDQTGLVWIATIDGVLKQKSLNSIPANSNSDNLPLDSAVRHVKSIFEDDESLWIGTIGEGLKIFNNSGDQITNFDNEVATTIYDIDPDHENGVWIAHDKGVIKTNRLTGKKDEETANTLANLGIGSLPTADVHLDDKHNIWLATLYDGIIRYDPISKSVRSFKYRESDSTSLLANEYWFVYQDTFGFFWFGSEDKGLTRYSEADSILKHFKHNWRDSISISSNRLISIAEDEQDVLWVGTRRGLNRFDRNSGSFKRYFQEHGLPNEQVVCIIPYGKNILWIATRNGLARFDSSKEEFLTFSEQDGLPSTKFYFNACHKSDSGDLYLGSDVGLIRVHPDSLLAYDQKPEVILTSYEVQGEPHLFLNEPQSLSFEHNRNFLTFFFSSTDYLGLEQNQYRYQLTGVHDDWIFAHRRNSASYANLKPGEYTFRVQSSNHRGTWSDSKELAITIKPPFWQESWFIALTAAFLLAMSISIYQWRVNDLLQRKELEKRAEMEAERMRTKIAQDLHDDLGADASRLSMSIERLMQDDSITNNQRSMLKERLMNARYVAGKIRDLSWLLDSGSDQLQDFVDRLHREAGRAFDEDTLSITIEHRIPDRMLPSKVRHDMFLIFREAITNILRHAHASEVQIRVFYEDTVFGFEIVDNGVGYDMDDSSPGNGRGNMLARAERIGAKLTFDSAIGRGTTVLFRYEMA